MSEPAGGSKPCFAVLLCTHNGERFLAEQLASLASQTLLPSVVFVHDWGSGDDTRQLLVRAYETAPPGQRWELNWHDEAPGPARSFLRAIEACLAAEASFDFLCLCDQDDVWMPTKLATMAAAVHVQPHCDVLYADVRVTDAQGRTLWPSYHAPVGVFGRPMAVTHPSALWVNTIAGMSMVVSRRLLMRARPVWCWSGWVMHDWAIVIVAHLMEASVCHVPCVLVNYRQHGGNVLGSPVMNFQGALRTARAYVQAVAHQYEGCMRIHALTGVGRALTWPSRLQVLSCVVASPSLPRWRALRAAVGFALFWPNRVQHDEA